MALAYRKEIDGLRAVAVVPVVLFHAGFSTFSGGFVGRSRDDYRHVVPGSPEEDRLLVWDYGHLSVSGSQYLAETLFRDLLRADPPTE